MLFFSYVGNTRELHVLTHSFPTRRSSDLEAPGLAQVHLRRNLAAVRIAHLWQPHGTEQHGVRRRGRLAGRLVERDATLAVDQGAGFQRGEVQLEAAHGTAGGSQTDEARRHHLMADADRKSTRLNSSQQCAARMPTAAL